MKRNINVFLFCLLTLPSLSPAQIVNVGGTANTVLREKDYVHVEGSPYYYTDWKKGGLLSASGVMGDDYLLRYDTYRDEVQVLVNDKAIVYDSKNIKEFYFAFRSEPTSPLTHTTFKNGYAIEGFSNTAYFQVMYETPVIKFLRRHKTDYVEEQSKAFGTNELVKRFINSQTDYVTIGTHVLKLDKARKKLFENAGSNEEPLKKFAKDNKLKLKEDADFVRLLQYYSQLIDDK